MPASGALSTLPRFAHRAKAARDDASDGLSGLRVFRQRLILHALLDFNITRFGSRFAGNDFVNVSGHRVVSRLPGKLEKSLLESPRASTGRALEREDPGPALDSRDGVTPDGRLVPVPVERHRREVKCRRFRATAVHRIRPLHCAISFCRFALRPSAPVPSRSIRISRGSAPRLGPTIPRDSSSSMIRAARP